ncbi:MAG TPA: hypothetical protein VJ801_11715, partial [Polyangia bacterium]|nr:hypothetical protein [Polyangia bacterium]
LFASQPHQVLIYTEDRFVKWEGTASRAVLRFMGQELKRYAWAHLTKDGKVSLDYYAPKQDW